MRPFTRREWLGTAAGVVLTNAQPPALPPLEAARTGVPVRSAEVIDTHGHIDRTPPGAVWPRNVDLLIEDMDRCGARQVVVSHFGALQATTAADLREAHDDTARAAARHAGRVRAYVVFQPWLRDVSRAELNRILAPDSPFVGIKLHGPVHAYAADGPAYRDAFAFANEHSLPVLFHVGQGLEAVPGIAVSHPRMKLILAHYGGGSAAVLKRVRELPNLFIDTCTSNGPRRIVERLVEACGPEKILYGSDSVYLCMGSQTARVAMARIPDADKRRIFGANARAIFGSRLAPPA
jgi:predicted TIM-barrel fold metal-dependent hydrolase